MEEASSDILSRDTGYRGVFRLVWPLALGMANNAVMQFFDRVMLAHESAASLEAVLPASMLVFTIVGFFQSVVAYSGTFVAQYRGAEDFRGCRASYFCALVLAAVCALAACALVPAGLALLDWAGHSPEVLRRERAYFSIVMLGGWALCAQMAAAAYFTGLKRTRLVFWVNLAGNAANVLFDWLLIFGVGPFPAMGIAGAAWATVGAQALQAVILNVTAALDRRPPPGLPASGGPFIGYRTLALRMFRYGIPAGVHNVAMCLAFTIFVFVTGKLGDLAFAVSNAAFTVNYLIYAPMEGFAVGAGVLVGHHQGAGDSAAAVRDGNRTVILAVSYIVVVSLAAVIFHVPILGWFSKGVAPADLPEFMRLGFVLFALMASWQIFDCIETVLSGALKGAGDTRFVMGWMILMSFGFWLPLVWLAYRLHPSMETLWATQVAYVAIFAAGTFVRWKWGPWRRIRLIS